MLSVTRLSSTVPKDYGRLSRDIFGCSLCDKIYRHLESSVLLSWMFVDGNGQNRGISTLAIFHPSVLA